MTNQSTQREPINRLKIVLSTIDRAHIFDLARQLHKRSALTAIFSGYPWFKLKGEHIPRHLVHTFPWMHAPYMGLPLERVLGGRLTTEWEWWDHCLFDRNTAIHLPDCDVFLANSGCGLRAGIESKLRGASYVCDRGSSHIRFQDRILREEYDRLGMPFRGIDPRVVECEEAEYETADIITVPSTFARRSFESEGVPAHKVKLIAYGVDLSRFQIVAKPDDRSFDVLFVGAVSVQKGIRDLLKAFDLLVHPRKRLIIVGKVRQELKETIYSFAASRDDIRVLGHVPQLKLKEYMSRAHVMVLPSIQEGMALVQAQAMSCGCPVIATINTGAEDLFTDGIEGFIVGTHDPDAICQRLQRLAGDQQLRERMAAAARAKMEKIGGWDLYGERMYRLLCDTGLA